MKIDHVVPIIDKPGRLMFSGTAWSRMRLNLQTRQHERVWYLTLEDCLADRKGHGDPREDEIVVSDGSGPPPKSRRP